MVAGRKVYIRSGTTGTVHIPTLPLCCCQVLTVQVFLQREIPLRAVDTSVTALRTNQSTFRIFGGFSLIVNLSPLHQSASPTDIAENSVHVAL